MSRKNHQKRNFCQKTSLCLDASKVIISTVITVRILTISNIKFAQMFRTVIAWWFYVTDYNHWSMHSRNLWLFVISIQNDLFLMTYYFWKFAATPKEIELIFEHHRACSKGWNSFVEFKWNIFIIFSVEIKNHRSVIILSSVQVFKTEASYQNHLKNQCEKRKCLDGIFMWFKSMMVTSTSLHLHSSVTNRLQ